MKKNMSETKNKRYSNLYLSNRLHVFLTIWYVARFYTVLKDVIFL